MSIDRDRTEEFDVEQQYAGNTALKYIKNNHTESKKIGVQVDIERAETEVTNYVKSQNARSSALTALKTAKLRSWLPLLATASTKSLSMKICKV